MCQDDRTLLWSKLGAGPCGKHGGKHFGAGWVEGVSLHVSCGQLVEEVLGYIRAPLASLGQWVPFCSSQQMRRRRGNRGGPAVQCSSQELHPLILLLLLLQLHQLGCCCIWEVKGPGRYGAWTGKKTHYAELHLARLCALPPLHSNTSQVASHNAAAVSPAQPASIL